MVKKRKFQYSSWHEKIQLCYGVLDINNHRIVNRATLAIFDVQKTHQTAMKCQIIIFEVKYFKEMVFAVKNFEVIDFEEKISKDEILPH